MTTQQVQKTILAPTMRHSIEVLLLPLADINQSIEQELEENPLLEIDEENAAHLSENKESQRIEDWLNSSPRISSEHWSDDETVEESPLKTEISLEDELLRQLHVELADTQQIKIGEHIIGNLDEDGYLNTTCEEIARALGIAEAGKIENVLRMIQEFEPAGIASRTLSECLLIQARNKNFKDKDLICRMIEDHLNDLGRRKFKAIAQKMSLPLSVIQEAARRVAALEPRPARNHRPIYSSIYVKPDVFLKKDDKGGYQIEISKEGVPPLRVNPYYKNLLANGRLSPEERRFICEKIKKAGDFIKSIEQRGQTLRTITEHLLRHQKNFFEHGYSALTPMTLKDVAQAVGRNESTVSRAISNKFIDTPQGILPLKFFFSQSIPSGGPLNPADAPQAQTHLPRREELRPGAVASRSIKEEIKEMIETEDKSSPLSDQEIQKYFTRKNTLIARRTISKYRQALRILPSNLRRV